MNFGKNLKEWVSDNDTSLLTGVGTASGLILGGYLWYKTGKKVQNRILSKECELNRKLTFKEKIKDNWKLFILPAVNTLLSGTMIIYASRVGNKRLAALGAAYNTSTAALQTYIDKTKEIVGEKKANDIQKATNEQIVKDGNNTLVISNDNETKFYEPLTDRYFKSTWAKIQKAANELNAEARTGFDGRISLTDWFFKLGLAKTDISDEMGWDPQKDGVNGIIDIYPGAVLDNEDSPVGVIRYNTRPKYFE